MWTATSLVNAACIDCSNCELKLTRDGMSTRIVTTKDIEKSNELLACYEQHCDGDEPMQCVLCGKVIVNDCPSI